MLLKSNGRRALRGRSRIGPRPPSGPNCGVSLADPGHPSPGLRLSLGIKDLSCISALDQSSALGTTNLRRRGLAWRRQCSAHAVAKSLGDQAAAPPAKWRVAFSRFCRCSGGSVFGRAGAWADGGSSISSLRCQFWITVVVP
jgi:hypothetical protein